MKLDHPAISTKNLTRKFGELTAVNSVNLDVPQGSVYGFLGPNGAGKTTTIRLLLGLIRLHAGHIQVFGRPFIKERHPLLKQIGALVESPSIYNHLTGRENLEVTRRLLKVPKENIDVVLHTVNLEDAADRKVGQYSTGMRQRLGLALALLNNPRLLILDEPTNGLDPAGIQEFRHLIQNFPKEKGITVFLSSHLLNEVEQMATHIGVIDKGQLLFQGTITDLKSRLLKHVLLQVDNPEKANHILQQKYSIEFDQENNLKIQVKDKFEASEINAVLVNSGIKVYSIHLENPSLESIFFSLINKEQN
ncbi:MAG: ATP-binding cassette domain-containing protein [Candidatus Aminicenantes bacterium]|nr:ATP-binding cassette domain-containing protein [Candidatus Aminicenantes bacterium]